MVSKRLPQNLCQTNWSRYGIAIITPEVISNFLGWGPQSPLVKSNPNRTNLNTIKILRLSSHFFLFCRFLSPFFFKRPI